MSDIFQPRHCGLQAAISSDEAPGQARDDEGVRGDGGIALLFAGQGAQHPGMGAGLAEASPVAAAVFAAADAACPGTRERCLTADAEELARTEVTQPTVLAVDLACARLLEEAGVRPAAVAGFSLGEIGALAFAGVFDDRTACALIAQRARLMEAAARSPRGGLRAVLGKTADDVRTLVKASGQDGLELVNFNAPTQVVVAGPIAELTVLGDFLKSQGVRSVPLAVSGAFHSSFMRPAADGFAGALTRTPFSRARIPVYANVTGEPYPLEASGSGSGPGFGAKAAAATAPLSPFDEAQAKTLLARQISSPVRWTCLLENLRASGITRFVEVGPGAVLTGLVRKTLPGVWCRSVSNVEQAHTVAAELEQLESSSAVILREVAESSLKSATLDPATNAQDDKGRDRQSDPEEERKEQVA